MVGAFLTPDVAPRPGIGRESRSATRLDARSPLPTLECADPWDAEQTIQMEAERIKQLRVA
jgi:hypothetical protein